MSGKEGCSFPLFTAHNFYSIKHGSAALSPRWRCSNGGTASLLRLLLLFALLGFHQVFMPGYFFGLVHDFSPIKLRVRTTLQVRRCFQNQSLSSRQLRLHRRSIRHRYRARRHLRDHNAV